MLIKHKGPSVISENEVTPQAIYQSRRKFLKTSAMTGAAAISASYFPNLAWAKAQDLAARLADAKTTYQVDEELNTWDEVTGYNNFYELGTGKSDPIKNADKLKTANWQVEISGECAKPGVVNLEDLISPQTLEERIYRFRCVEAWSMVIPWVGFSLGDMLKRFEPTGNAKYVSFETIYDKNDPLPGQRRRVLDWPYREGLRMDEAMNPLALMVVGVYGKVLPNQNGAPLRLMVPWKYGFKSIKSIVKIHFSEQQPESSWNLSAPSEYGFYSNVNPDVSHPRWSQASERRIGEFFRRPTLPFNGYADEVAGLYSGMDLKKYY